jgi:hypothetical protein
MHGAMRRGDGWHRRWMPAGAALALAAMVGTVAAGPAGPAGAAAAATPFAVVPSPVITGSTTLNGVSALSPTEAWAVGSFKVPGYDGGLAALALHGNGTTWTAVPASDTRRFDEVLTAVDEISAGDVWAVGYRKRTGAKSPVTPLALHWDGAAWTEVSPPPTSDTRASLTGVAAVSPSDVWAVGRTGTTVLIEHWDGRAWSAVVAPLPGGATSASLAGVSATGPADVWAVGTAGFADGSGRTLVEHWDGRAWWVVTSADAAPQRPGARPADHLDAVTALGPADVWAVGGTIDTVSGSGLDDRTVTQHWDGTRWTLVPSPSPFGHNLLKAVAAGAGGEVWAFGDGWTDAATTVPVATQVILRWDGRAWARAASANVGATDNLLNGAAAAPGIVWAVGRVYPDATLTLARSA